MAALSSLLLVGVEIDLRGEPASADSTVLSSRTDGLGALPAADVARSESADETHRNGKSEAPGPRGTAAPKASARETPPRGQAVPAPRRFAWAPAPRADGYWIEFFREDVRIYVARTRDTQLALPAQWTFEGRPQRLTRGRYYWYVWPIVSSRRLPTATVQARLDIR